MHLCVVVWKLSIHFLTAALLEESSFPWLRILLLNSPIIVLSTTKNSCISLFLPITSTCGVTVWVFSTIALMSVQSCINSRELVIIVSVPQLSYTSSYVHVCITHWWADVYFLLTSSTLLWGSCTRNGRIERTLSISSKYLIQNCKQWVECCGIWVCIC